MDRIKKEDISKIAQNLIDILEKGSNILPETKKFVGNWIRTTNGEKNKSYYDIWEIVLKNYLPTTRPILFRSTPRIYKNDRISSFTSSLICADRFSEGKGYLIICDTNQSLKFEEILCKKGNYKNSFYPITEILKKAKENGGWGFTDDLLNNYTGEEEYIMKVNFDHMNTYKYYKK